MGTQWQTERDYFTWRHIDDISTDNRAARGPETDMDDDTFPFCTENPDRHLWCWENYRVVLRKFVYWAFKYGFPGLQYLVYGDFPTGKLGWPDNIVFYGDRHEVPRFRVLKASDEKMQHLWSIYSDFLTATPPTRYDDI